MQAVELSVGGEELRVTFFDSGFPRHCPSVCAGSRAAGCGVGEGLLLL